MPVNKNNYSVPGIHMPVACYCSTTYTIAEPLNFFTLPFPEMVYSAVMCNSSAEHLAPRCSLLHLLKSSRRHRHRHTTYYVEHISDINAFSCRSPPVAAPSSPTTSTEYPGAVPSSSNGLSKPELYFGFHRIHKNHLCFFRAARLAAAQ
jgi:hypothetical protein